MFYKAKNIRMKINDAEIDYIKFGNGKENLIIIPGVGDGFHSHSPLDLRFAPTAESPLGDVSKEGGVGTLLFSKEKCSHGSCRRTIF